SWLQQKLRVRGVSLYEPDSLNGAVRDGVAVAAFVRRDAGSAYVAEREQAIELVLHPHPHRQRLGRRILEDGLEVGNRRRKGELLGAVRHRSARPYGACR